ncbi:DDT domain-containing protein DDR4-like [Camellia sinensis]|uniref:DDT domain-containing protein DDR4-like n=1 Tax=Camellia sinensis TaxID=4442 RepID=UPI00103618D8|nr:DDT domain-containing protein DDR4-like [Camellia sinensis]
MSENRRRKTPTVAAGGETREDLAMVSELSPTESELARLRLRQRWEFASVLNFLHVFEPVIESKMKVSAEDIETALITPNNLLAQLHIMLLKVLVSSLLMN